MFVYEEIGSSAVGTCRYQASIVLSLIAHLLSFQKLVYTGRCGDGIIMMFLSDVYVLLYSQIHRLRWGGAGLHINLIRRTYTIVLRTPEALLNKKKSS